MKKQITDFLQFSANFLGLCLSRKEILLSDRLILARYCDRTGKLKKFSVERTVGNSQPLDRRDSLRSIEFPSPPESFRHILSPSPDIYHQSLGIWTWHGQVMNVT
jgi:hypothetical protein